MLNSTRIIRRRRASRAALAAIAALLVAPAAAAAHAGLVSSEPAPGSELQAGPGQITISFTEPLNRGLTEATLINVKSGDRVAAESSFPAQRELRLVPTERLESAPFRVKWRTVSTVDGHALEGAFGFGVGVPAAEGEASLEQSPLARGGEVRIAARALLYGSLFFFAGGLFAAVALAPSFAAAALAPSGSGARWLLPAAIWPALAGLGRSPEALVDRAWRRTLDTGWLAAGAALAVVALEALDAAGGLDARAFYEFLLTNSAGVARLATVALLLVAAVLAPRFRIAASAAIAGAFLTIALSGHAFSAELRGLAVLTDWLHLVAAAVWIGGIGQIAWMWVPLARRAGPEARRAGMRSVLTRFGRLALPAFLVVAATGLVNALIQLGEPTALWQTGYGRVLAAKIALVALVALASYGHALRLRPRLLTSAPDPLEPLERRHWRLLGSEPLLAAGVIVAVAVLVAFPLPPQQLGEAGDSASAACAPCPVPAPAADELPVADDAGSRLVAFWLDRREGRLIGTTRIFGRDGAPAKTEVRLEGAELTACGAGCRRFSLPADTDQVEVAVEEDGREHIARVPARWRTGADARARRLLGRAQATMRSLRSVRQLETLTAGPGTLSRIHYAIAAPDRLAYGNAAGRRSIIIGSRRWLRSEEGWTEGRFGGGDRFSSRDFFRWTPYAEAARLIAIRRAAGRRVAEVAIMNSGAPAIWFRLRIDLDSMRVLSDRMTTFGHFMERRYSAFNRPVRIEPPTEADIE